MNQTVIYLLERPLMERLLLLNNYRSQTDVEEFNELMRRYRINHVIDKSVKNTIKTNRLINANNVLIIAESINIYE